MKQNLTKPKKKDNYKNINQLNQSQLD